MASADVSASTTGASGSGALRRNDRGGLLWSTRLRTLVPGATADDRRAYGGALAACGDFSRAAKVLESLVEDGAVENPDDELARARRLRARLN